MVDGATREWIPIVLDVPQGGVLGPLMSITYDNKMFVPVENSLFTHADDCMSKTRNTKFTFRVFTNRPLIKFAVHM